MKVISTKKKVAFLYSHIKEKYADWLAINKSNIVGFRIDKKVTEGKMSRNYAIIFQVKSKKEVESLSSKTIIPKYFEVAFPDKKTRKIKTDVEETGTFELYSNIGNQISKKGSAAHGSLGLFVKDDKKKYAITNYHVVAKDKIDRGEWFYQRQSNQNQTDVTIIDTKGKRVEGVFEIGLYSEDVDVSFIDVTHSGLTISNELPQNVTINSYVNKNYVLNKLKNQEAKFYTFFNKFKNSGTVYNPSVIVPVGNFSFVDLIQVYPNVCRKGDSGGLSITNFDAVIGIVVGGDDKYAYVIPLYKIYDFKNFTLI